MGRPRFENLDPEKQGRLFDSAAEEFAAKGYDGASLNQILQNAGMSKSSLYYYFDDKGDLFSSLLQRSFEYLMKEIGGFDIDALTAETYWDELEARMHRSVTAMSKKRWYVKLGRLFWNTRGRSDMHKTTGRLYELVRQETAKMILRGQELGVIRDDLPQSLLLDMMMAMGETFDIWMFEHFEEMGETESQAYVTTCIAVLRRTFEPEASHV